ncbi:hypothetical protein L873DRAFT_1816286 [Choiromyces venosus 120613-1]|uniref:Uncharacterized protein n=1 Tax=Choiromyces venosus 120613-1 TaxID=1336337 RepID=A0A3N4J539_9PEZI|nr:hypothetical protein L873DRAFT_1816286 [Choiromyces venosus 120613-1]
MLTFTHSQVAAEVFNHFLNLTPTLTTPNQLSRLRSIGISQPPLPFKILAFLINIFLCNQSYPHSISDSRGIGFLLMWLLSVQM